MNTMKRWNKKAMLTATCATLAALVLLTVGAWTASAGTFDSTGQTVAETESVWGKPSVIQKFADGTEKRFYKCNGGMDTGFRYFIYKDSKAIDDGGLQRYAPEPQREQPAYQVVMPK